MRWLALVALLALVATGSALAAKGDPQRKITQTDQKLAKSLLVTRADLGQGWRSRPADTDDPDVECPGYKADESDLVLTGEADSPELTLENPTAVQFVTVGSTASVYKTQKQAVAAWTRGVKPGLAECLAYVMEVQAKREGSKLDVRPVKRAAPLPSLAPRQVAYRFEGTLTSGQAKVRMHIDVVFLGRGRGLTSLLVASLVNPVPADQVAGLARLASGRLEKAFGKPPAGPTA